jgi:type III secretion system FlhB-like substrate exporter
MVEQPAELTRRVPQSGITAEAAGGIPPQLHQAVNEVLAFIYELDQQVERKGRKR